MPDFFYGLCASCRETLAIPVSQRGNCSLCGQPLLSETGICLPCRNGPVRSFDQLISLFPYTGKYQKVFKEYKFNKRLSLGNFFIEKLWDGLDLLFIKNGFEPVSDIGWVPVPARPGKIKTNGWDQIDYLASLLENDISRQRLNKTPRISVRRCLKRLRSKSQKELNKENRLQNLQGKIIVNTNSGPSKKSLATMAVPKTAVIFDDVYTTGSTMDACASALKSGGAERVYGICLCYD